MKKYFFSKRLSLLLCVVLIAAMAFLQVGCGENQKTDNSVKESTLLKKAQENVLGKGKKEFVFVVVNGKSKESFTIRTNKKTGGEALMELDLIDGDEGQYGLYVKTVNGITVDYDKDGKYWAFYVNGEYAMQGVELTEIKEDDVYSFKVKK